MSYEQSAATVSSPFEQASVLAYDLHARYHSHNTLVVPPFGENAGGLVLPVVTTLKYQELPTRDITVRDTHIDVSQRYPALTAAATYVGLWPNGDRGAGTAVLYQTETAFTPESIGGQLPFRETMNDLLEEFSPVEVTDDADVKVATPASPPPLKGTADTQIVDHSAGYNSVEKTRYWRPALSGSVVVELAADRIVKITENTLLGAAQKIINLELTGDEQTILNKGYHTLPEDASLVLDSETGEVRIQNATGAIESVHPPFALNPVLANLPETVYKQAADQLKWRDITGRTLDHNRLKLYRKAGLAQDTAYNAIQEQALQELANARQGLEPKPLATIGVVAYLEKLRDTNPAAGHLVNRSYTTLK